MADESTSPEAVETESDIPEVAEIEAEADAPEIEEDADEADSQEDGDEGEDDDEPVEEVEFNFNGEKLRLPKGSIPEELAAKVEQFVKGAEGTTTRKLQEVAEARKSVEAREQAVEKLCGLSGEILNTYSRGLQLRQELEQLSQINVSQLWQSNPDQARQVSDAISRKTAEFQNVVSDVEGKERALTQAQQAEIARKRDEGRQAINKRVPDFETKALPKVLEYAVNVLGIDPEAAKNDWPLNPAMTLAVHKAQQFDEMQARAKAKPKPATAKPVTPITPIRGKGGTGQRDVAQMSPGEMAKFLGLPG